MSKALLSSERQIARWLDMQLIDRPNQASHADYTTVLGGGGPFKSIKALLDVIINRSEWDWSVGHALDELGDYFRLPKDWWKNREGFGAWLLDPMAAAFADAWIYREWLREHQPEIGDAYMEFFAKSVMHPEWFKAVEAQWVHHPSVGGNIYDVLPNIGDFMRPDQLQDRTWHPSYKQKIGRELNRRALETYQWLQNVFVSPKEDKAKKLEEGMNHISLAAIKGDENFFIGLGKALSETYEPCQNLTLEEVQKQPISKSRKAVTHRIWCRRIWISRGLWVMPPHLLQQEPFSLSQTSISELTGKRYRGNKKLPQNDALYCAEALWFNEWQDATATISLTTDGKKMLPDYARKGVPWGVVSADFI